MIYCIVNLQPSSSPFSYQQKYRTYVGPADAPEDTRLGAQHLLHICAEPINAIEPKHPGRLNKHHEENGQSGSIDIQEVDQDDATL